MTAVRVAVHNFAYAALAMNSTGTPVPGQSSYSDVVVNPGNTTPFVSTPYILVRGAMPQERFLQTVEDSGRLR